MILSLKYFAFSPSLLLCNDSFHQVNCCDFRRAVMVLSIIGMVVFSLYAIGTGIDYKLDRDEFCTDNNLEDDDEKFCQLLFGIFIGSNVGMIVASVVGFIGALKFHNGLLVFHLMLLFTLNGLILYTEFESALDGAAILYRIVFRVIGICFFVYPVISLIKEIQSGIMSKETYWTREADSACCLPHQQNDKRHT